MAIVSDEGVFETEIEHTIARMGLKAPEKLADALKSPQGTVGKVEVPPSPEAPKELIDPIEKVVPLTRAIDRAIDDIIMLNPGFREYKGFNKSPNIENRIEDTTIKPEEPITKDLIDQTEGKFINPAQMVDEELPREMGVNILNKMILEREAGKTPRGTPQAVEGDQLGRLIDELKRKHPERFPKPKKKK